MSQRPRLAGDGRLTLPSEVSFGNQGFILGRFSDKTADPFEWTAERLLLAESFARLDLEDLGALEAWWVANGALDPYDFMGGDAEVPDEWGEHRQTHEFAESRKEGPREQANVRWHLATMVRLSEHRDDKTWDPAWGELALRGPINTYLVGGAHAGAQVWSPSMVALARKLSETPPPFHSLEEQLALPAEVTRRPMVTVRRSGWYGYWDDVMAIASVTELRPEGFTLASTWDSALDFERRLIEPYVAIAVERGFSINLQPRPEDGRNVLVPRESRGWLSVLAPIYLQLFESLRRISEGEPGAAVCRECGKPFLVLDARRRFFCNDRERFRFSQRERRRRLATEASEADTEIDATIDVKVGEDEAESVE